MRYLTLARGFMAADEPVIHFGLGDHERIEWLSVQWPSGRVQRFADLAADRFYTITEPSGAAEGVSAAGLSVKEAPPDQSVAVASSSAASALASPDAGSVERSSPVGSSREETRPDQPVAAAFLSAAPALASPDEGPSAAGSLGEGVGSLDQTAAALAGVFGRLPAAAAMFRRSAALEWVEHVERPFDDYARQPLLPYKLSQLGPGLAWGDVDGDGDEDLYVGGAAGRGGMLCLNRGPEGFEWAPLAVFDRDKAHEDMAPLFVDVEGDGDLDLFVVSGGGEFEPDDALLRDRLYLNDGRGGFVRAPGDALPDTRESGGPAAAGDFDRDGDLDLFVGGRQVPGRYPQTPRSQLLRNDGGRFADVTEQLAPGLALGGLVTGALWSDADADGWPDLLVTHEWGPVKLYRNERGRLVERTAQAGLAQRLGWWNGIAGGDLDGDGDLDYVVTNFGLNTKYEASPERPALLYYGDFDATGRPRLIEADYEDETLYPVRGKSCSTHAMPSLAGKFPTFRQFALASLQDVYTPQCLADAERFEATTLLSGVLLNDGAGRFEFRPLPRLAQASPGFGVVVDEVDGDGTPDLYIAQNFFSPQPETGRMDGGISLLLTGRGDGTFEPVRADRSGLVVPGDAKGLTATDLNGDGWVDFVVGRNDDQLLAFEHRGGGEGRMLGVRLRGPRGNPTAVGARVGLRLADGSLQTAEVRAGGSYLSQSGGDVRFGLGPAGEARRLTVQWPDGQTTELEPPEGQARVTVTHPAHDAAPDAALNPAPATAAAADEADTPAGIGATQRAQAHLELGEALQAKGRARAAARHYHAALALRPEWPRTHNRLGELARERGDLEGAERHLKQALALDAAHPAALVNLGRARAEQGDPPAAIDLYRQALEAAPDHAEAHRQLGLALEAAGELREAFEHLERALRARPGDATLHDNLGYLRLSEGRAHAAIGHYRLALSANPDNATAHAYLGDLLGDQGRLGEAVEHYRQALAIDPQSARTHNNLGRALVQQGDLRQGVGHYRQALTISPYFAQGHYNLGNALSYANQLRPANAHYRQALQIEPNLTEVHNSLGTNLALLGELPQAIEHFTQATQIDPTDAKAHYNLGLAHNSQGRLDQAVHHYQKSLRHRPGDPNTHNNLGLALSAQGKREEAIHHFQQALTHAPNHPQAQKNLSQHRQPNP